MGNTNGARSALVTAGSRGIGQACAAALARDGFRVAICARNDDGVRAAVAAIGGEGAGHRGYSCDLGAAGAPERLAAEVRTDFGEPDVIVHNLGGTLSARDPLAGVDVWNAVLTLNLGVAIALNAVLLPAMISRKWGRVIAISSAASIEHHGALPYAVAKAALNTYVHGLGRELAASGVVVSAVVPGTVMTAGGVWDERRRTDPAAIQRYIDERLPAKRFQDPASIAELVAFLATDRGRDFAGAIIPIDAGQCRAF